MFRVSTADLQACRQPGLKMQHGTADNLIGLSDSALLDVIRMMMQKLGYQEDQMSLSHSRLLKVIRNYTLE